MIKLIGISGKANVGKDYVARILKARGWTPFHFALHLKMDAIGKGEGTYEEVMVTKPPHVRRRLQLKGTEEGRMVYGEDIWIKTLDAWLTYFSTQWQKNSFVIPDVRFENEAEYIKSRGGILIRVISEDRLSNSKLTEEQKAHDSEIALDSLPDDYFNGIVVNNLNTRTKDLIVQLNKILNYK
jgi:hypothetical protein